MVKAGKRLVPYDADDPHMFVRLSEDGNEGDVHAVLSLRAMHLIDMAIAKPRQDASEGWERVQSLETRSGTVTFEADRFMPDGTILVIPSGDFPEWKARQREAELRAAQQAKMTFLVQTLEEVKANA